MRAVSPIFGPVGKKQFWRFLKIKNDLQSKDYVLLALREISKQISTPSLMASLFVKKKTTPKKQQTNLHQMQKTCSHSSCDIFSGLALTQVQVEREISGWKTMSEQTLFSAIEGGGR